MDKVKIGFPIEYEDENNIVRNGLFLREPEIKELEKRLKEINKITDLKQQVKKKQEVIDKLQQENKQLKDNWNELRKWIVYNKHNENTEQHYLVVDYGTLLGKMQKLEQGSDSDV